MNRTRRVGGTISVLVVLAATACSSDGEATSEDIPTATSTPAAEEPADDPAETESLDATVITAAPTTELPVTVAPDTVEASATTTPSGDTIVIPFHVIDVDFPVGWTCDEAIPGFDVAFTDADGRRTNVEARFDNAFNSSNPGPNAACAIEEYEGAPALFLTAQLVAPAAGVYSLIETRYPYAGGVGNDRYETHFASVTADEAQAGLYVGRVALDPSEVADLPFPVVE